MIMNVAVSRKYLWRAGSASGGRLASARACSISWIQRLRALIDARNPACELEVDGGIDLRTAPTCAKAGATVFVAGTSIFGAKNGPRAATAELARAVQA